MSLVSAASSSAVWGQFCNFLRYVFFFGVKPYLTSQSASPRAPGPRAVLSRQLQMGPFAFVPAPPAGIFFLHGHYSPNATSPPFFEHPNGKC